MIRTILKPTKNDLTLTLPDNLIGKLVEVIAFEIEESVAPEKANIDKKARIRTISSGLDKYRADLTGFKFNRDEANDYE